MKKLMALVLALVLSMTLTACIAEDVPAPGVAEAQDQLVFELDYDTIASWIYGGYLGQTEDGSPMLLAINEDASVAIALFGDNTTMEAVSFIGYLTDNGDGTVTITDPASELMITFGFEQDGEQYIMDMGEEIGSAILEPVELNDLLTALKNAIENYTHVA